MVRSRSKCDCSSGGLVTGHHGYRRMVGAASSREGREGLDILKIRDAGDVEQAVRAAIAAEQPLEIIGHGTRRGIGQPMTTNAVLDLSPLNAVTSYEPNELIVTVQAGAPLADVMSLID